MCNHLPKAVQVSLPPEGGGPRSGGRSFFAPTANKLLFQIHIYRTVLVATVISDFTAIFTQFFMLKYLEKFHSL